MSMKDLYVKKVSTDIADKVKDHFIKLALGKIFPHELILTRIWKEPKLYDDIIEIIYRKLTLEKIKKSWQSQKLIVYLY